MQLCGNSLLLNVRSKRLYIIAGCNGAGKTTASFNILPDLLDCREYVNADEIARGISPFQPEKVAIESGRIMLNRINELMHDGVDFAFETTLATKSFINTIAEAKEQGYFITLIFFWLKSQELAMKRVQNRVKEGGHNIPETVIKRRFSAGLKNLFDRYFDAVDLLLIYDNSAETPKLILEKEAGSTPVIFDEIKMKMLKAQRDE